MAQSRRTDDENMHPCLIESSSHSDPVDTNETSLDRARAHVRRRIRNKAIRIIRDKLPSIAYLPPLCEDYEEEYTRASDIHVLAPGGANKLIGPTLKIWRELVDQINESASQFLKPPPYLENLAPTSEGPDKPQYRQWRQLNQLKSDFKEKFESDDLCLETPQIAFGVTVLSAILSGSILNEDGLLAFVQYARREIPLYRMPPDIGLSLIWMDVSYGTNSAGNVRDGDTVLNEVQLFLDTRTLALLQQFWHMHPPVDLSHKEVKKAHIWSLLKDTLAALNLSHSLIRSLKAFLDAAVGSCIFQPGLCLSQSLLSQARGTVPSVGLRHDQWHALLRPRVKVLTSYSAQLLQPTGSATTRKPSLMARLAVESRNAIRAIRRAIAENNAYGRKRTPARAIAALEGLDRSSWPFIACYVADFYSYKLGGFSDRPHGSIELSTLNKGYHGVFGYKLLRYAADWREDTLTFEQVEEMYTYLADEAATTNAAATVEMGLEQFNRFHKERYDAFYSAEVQRRYSKGAHRVRTAVISVALYDAVRASVWAIDGLDDLQKEALTHLWDIAYWAGTRPEDLTKIRVQDAESIGDLLIYLCDNDLGSGKNSEATRYLPLKVLLPEPRRTECAQWIENRSQKAPRSYPLFESPTGGGMPWDRAALSHIFSDLLRQCGGLDNAVFYDTRHTRISSWRLLADDAADLAIALGLYTQEHAAEVIDGLYGGIPGTCYSYWQATEASGHTGPRTPTSTYDHLGNPLRARHILSAENVFSPAAVRKMTGWSANRVTRMSSESNLPDGGVVCGLLRDHLSEKVTRAIPGARVRRPATVQGGPVNKKSFGDYEKVTSWYALLKDWKVGRTAEALSRQHPFDLEIVERVLNHIIELEQIRTKKGYSRLSGRDLNENNGRWIPPSPRSSAEITASNNIISAMRKKFKNPKIRDRFKRAFAYYLAHAVHSKNFVSFTRISDLRRFLWLFGSKVKPELWRAEVIYSQRQDEERMCAYWDRSDLHIQYHNKPTKRRVKNKDGSLRLILELDHKDKRVSEKLKARGDASMILRYIMPMVAMLVFSDEEIKQLHSDGTSSQTGD